MRNKTGIILCICPLAGTVAGCGLEASDATVLGNGQTLVTGESAGGIVSPELDVPEIYQDIIYYYNEDQGRIIMVHISGGYYILNLYESGVVTQEDGDGNGIIAYYQFQPDIKWWELIIWRKLDREENPRYYRYSGEESDVTEEVPEEEARQIIDQLTKERIELEWILLDVL